MAWAALSTDDVKTRVAGAELTAYETAALASGQANPVPLLILQVVAEVRGYIAACASNTLDADATKIPDKLKAAALDIIRYRITTRLPIPVTEDRRREYEDALRLLRDTAACNFSIDDPSSGEEMAGGVEIAKSTTRQADRDKLAGF